MDQPIPASVWEVRRKIIIWSLIASLVALLFILVAPLYDRSLAELSLYKEAFTAILLLVGSLISSYVFGAAWDDKNRMTTNLAAITSTSTRSDQ